MFIKKLNQLNKLHKIYVLVILLLVMFFGFLLYTRTIVVRGENESTTVIYGNPPLSGNMIIDQIDSYISAGVRDELQKNELSGIVTSQLLVDRLALFLNFLSFIAILFFGAIGYITWNANEDRRESRRIVDTMRNHLQDTKDMRRKAQAIVQDIQVAEKSKHSLNNGE